METVASAVGGKRPNSASSLDDEENKIPDADEKRPRRAGERVPLANQANYITVSVPDDGRRTRVAVRSADHFRDERVAEANFLVWSCSKSWRDLKDVANSLLERSEHAVAAAQSQAATQGPIVTKLANTDLWLRKYAPSNYMDLVSDEATNRAVLQWFRLWDKGVYGKERKSKFQGHRDNQQQQQQQQQMQQSSKWNNNRNGPGGFNKQPPPGPAMDINNAWPAQRICLLTGPPGLGKTTLAHIAARHCGYDMIEVNASDDRSANVFRDYLESVVETRGMLNGSSLSKPRPACLIFDEIDGAPQAAVDVLIGYVTASSDLERNKQKRRGKDKQIHELKRPVICICNDQYATSLRNLRRHCFVVTCLPPPPERLVFRVGEIAKRERLEIESHAITQIVDRAHGDIRVCINILQTLKAAATGSSGATNSATESTQPRRNHRDTTRITNDLIARLPRMGFNKDVEQSMFDCLQAIFRLPSQKTHASRFETISASVQMNTDHELLVNGVFENYLNARVRDDYLVAASQMVDWMAFADTMHSTAMSIAGAEIGYAMTYTTTPLIAAACHLMFAVPAPGRLIFPKASMEMRQLQSQRNNQLSSLVAGFLPSERIFFSSPCSILFDLLPCLLDIIQPTLRPVSAQLFSCYEKMEITRVVETMSAFGLTFVQRLSSSTSSNEQNQWQSRGSSLGYYLEPPVDVLVLFEKKLNQHGGDTNKGHGEGDASNNQVQQSNVWRLSQSVRQLLASDIAMYLAKRASVKCGPLLHPADTDKPNDVGLDSNQSKEVGAAKSTTGMSVAASSMHIDSLDVNDGECKVQTAISSFFTRQKTEKKNTTNAFNTLVRSPPTGRSRDKVWYRFNEGYSNAVRRPARVKQFL